MESLGGERTQAWCSDNCSSLPHTFHNRYIWLGWVYLYQRVMLDQISWKLFPSRHARDWPNIIGEVEGEKVGSSLHPELLTPAQILTTCWRTPPSWKITCLSLCLQSFRAWKESIMGPHSPSRQTTKGKTAVARISKLSWSGLLWPPGDHSAPLVVITASSHLN